MRIYLWPIIMINSVVVSIYAEIYYLVGLLIGTGLIFFASGGFLLNDLVDRKTDLINNKKRLWEVNSKEIKKIYLLVVLFFSLGFFSFSLIGTVAINIAIILILLLVFYSILLRKFLLIANVTAALFTPVKMPQTPNAPGPSALSIRSERVMPMHQSLRPAI